MSTPVNIELEIKLDASGLDEKAFCRWLMDKEPVKYIKVEGADHFFRREDDVIRHRIPPDEPSQLTIKKRTSAVSIRERKEVDLEIPNTSVDLIEDFIGMAGYLPDIKLHKQAKVFWFSSKKEKAVVSFYTAQLLNSPASSRKIVEVEIEKGSPVSVETAKGYLTKWVQEINAQFKVDLKPLNFSLYEMFSSK